MPGIADQYRTIAAAAGWRYSQPRGWLQLLGADRLSFLHALVTNDVASLAPGQGVYAAWLTPQGRMISDLRVFARADRVVAGVPAAGAAALASALDGLVFAEDVAVADVSDTLATFTVIGGEAAGTTGRGLDVDPSALGNLAPWSQLDIAGGFIARTDDARLPSYEVIVAIDRASDVASSLSGAGAAPLTDELLTALRVDAGRPLFGVDMDTDTIPLEAGLQDRAISTTKGCYVGQEVIIRVLHRGGGRIARRLVTIAFDASASSQVAPAGTLRADGSDIGRVTTLATSLDGTRTTALAYVKREVAEVGRAVVTSATTPVKGTITGLAG